MLLNLTINEKSFGSQHLYAGLCFAESWQQQKDGLI